MIPKHILVEAANWVADHQLDPGDDQTKLSRSDLRQLYFRRAFEALSRAVPRIMGPDLPDCQVGYTFPCGRAADGSIAMAEVRVRPDHLLGYLPGDGLPSTFWPPEMEETYRRLWASSLP